MRYKILASKPKNKSEPDKLIAKPDEYNITLPPRSYIFAYAKKGWRRKEDFKNYLEDKLEHHHGAHLHGIIILEKNWFAFQEAHTSDGVRVHIFDNNALLRFTNKLLQGIQSMPMGKASMDNYHHTGLYEGLLSGKPSIS